MKALAVSLAALVASTVIASAEYVSTNECSSIHNRPIAVSTSTGRTTYLWPTTHSGWCSGPAIDSPFFRFDGAGSESASAGEGDGGEGDSCK